MPSLLRWLPCAVFCTLLGFSSGALRAADPVEFRFRLPPNSSNPFAREIWAEVVTPSQATLRLPAFFIGKDRFAVRARADEKGKYRLGAVTETIDGQPETLVAKPSGSAKKTVRKIEARPAIKLDPQQPSRFIFASGGKYVPIGANLAWATSGCVGFYKKAFTAFGQADLNWARVWMAHWSYLNLEWLPKDMGESPEPGTLDLRIADNWDKLVTVADNKGVYLQIVLQHHGQYSTKVDTSWPDNPWNAANPRGFLATPSDFFTSPEAVKLTRMKYRYIVARWGYSPSVLAWEFFNEVHWVDNILEGHDEAAVARWHSQMATFIRTVDHYGHLITTSTENLNSPIYADMDYFQPHLYSPNILVSARRIDPAVGTPARPVFYGETGDDHLPLTPEAKKTGIATAPAVWASLTGQSLYPAQPWQGAQLIEANRIGELGAVARFLAATKLGQHEGLTPFSSVVECAGHVPLALVGARFWQRRPAAEITVPLDGREAVGCADIPRIYMGSKEGQADGYSGQVTLHFDFAKATHLILHITDASIGGSAIRVSVDGTVCVEKTWPERKPDATGKTEPFSDEIPIPISAGVHTVLVENPGSPGWFDLSRIDTGLDIPVLAAIGQRGNDFLALWLWNRNEVFSLHPAAPTQGTLLIDALAAGTWRITWWNTIEGIPGKSTLLEHKGGALRLTTPLITRHAAVVLTRETP